ncbi:MAG: hypothetical protein PHQ20_03495 [Candidatus Moranbacteria bacterium]|nr:hypothetical protein [Candidatus Moranbacteria bacterium]
MSITRAISEQIQLVIQSNDYNYIRKADISDPLFGSLFKKFRSGAPARYFVRPNKTIKEYLKPTKIIQELKVFHIDKKGLYTSENGLEVFPGRLYRIFIETKPKNLIKFIDNYDFCAFPLPPIDDYDHVDGEHAKMIKNIKLKNPHKKNFKYIIAKHQTLNALVDNFDNNSINLAGINWLNRQIMHNISPILVDADSFPNQEIADDEIEIDEPLKEYMEIKKVNVSKIISGYRVFGHFALCCLELLADIEKQQNSTKCKNKNCDNYFVKSHGNEKYCSDDCRKESRAIQKKQERKIKSRLKIKIKKRGNPIPKRDF